MSDVIVVEKEILKSEVFRGLRGMAIPVYFDFLCKCRVKRLSPKPGRAKEKVILNNGQLVYTYAEAEAKGILRARFMRAIDELISKGFLDVVHSGSGGKKGDVSLYAISDRWKKFGTQKFVEASRPKDIRQGRGFARYWNKKRANIGIKNDNPTIIKNDNPNEKIVSSDYRKRNLKKPLKTA